MLVLVQVMLLACLKKELRYALLEFLNEIPSVFLLVVFGFCAITLCYYYGYCAAAAGRVVVTPVFVVIATPVLNPIDVLRPLTTAYFGCIKGGAWWPIADIIPT